MAITIENGFLNRILKQFTRDASNREGIVCEEPPIRMLLVDDDESFVQIMVQIAKKEGFLFTVCHSIKEVGLLTHWDFDIAILDYDLGDFTAVQLTHIVKHLRELPIVLISQYRKINQDTLPENIIDVVHKGVGAHSILVAAFAAYQMDQLKRGLKK